MSTQIAKTIWNQMKEMDSNLCMCMGVSKLAVIENGLQFNVKGLSFKGLVRITLNGADLYDVQLVNVVRKLNPVAASIGRRSFDTDLSVYAEFNDIYAEDLMDLLENEVENRDKKTYR